MSLESAYNTIEKLVEDFKTNEKHYLSSGYSESQVRIDFIDKFLIALGWDVNHDVQKNPYEQEVKVERGVDIGDARKRADYSFALTPNFRDTVFFVEAKKPSKNLFNPNDYFQAIRYGWNAENPIVVLTDFEELHIIDSRSQPNIKNVKFSLDKKIKSFHYSDYTNKEKFQEIYYLFSREAVADNSITKFAETLPKPKGKAFQKGLFAGAYKSLDDAFLEELDEIRNTLAKAFKKSNPSLDSESLTEATQRVIDRLVFIRFLEDKLIEGETHIDKYGEKSPSAWQDFINDSKQLNDKYNGVVFKEHFIDRMKALPLNKSENRTLGGEYPQGEGVLHPPDDTVFRGICEEICIQNSPYLFNYFPIHILGSIYERFLGKIVVATAKQVRIEEKPEVRKAGGVYYTPQYIVQYIVENTVGKLIESKTPKEISKLSFADISCGSGSFLITVYDVVLHYIAKWYQQNPAEAEKAGCINKEGQWILSLEQKKNILRKNIYGVDIDMQAVEVTQLSLFLKLLEDETLASIQQGELFLKSKILPDLSKNIVCGNSLIDMDFYDGELEFPGTERTIKPFNWESTFPVLFKSGGFDCIVGNPPYGALLTKDLKQYFLNKYVHQNYQLDSYLLFLERSISKLLGKSGFLGMIIPNPWLTNLLQQQLRKYVIENTKIIEIVHFKKKVFKVTVDTQILIIQNNDNPNNIVKVTVVEKEQTLGDRNNVLILHEQKIWIDLKGDVINIFLSNKDRSIIEKIKTDFHILDHFCNINVGIKPYQVGKGKPKQNRNVVENRVFDSSIKIDSSFRQYLRGSDIQRYIIKPIEIRFIKYGEWLAEPRPAANFDAKEKIFMRQTGDSLIGVIDNEKYLCLNNMHVLVPKSLINEKLSFLLGLINSKLLNWFYQKINPEAGEALAEVKKTNVSNLPIKNVDFTNPSEKKKHDDIAKHVETMLGLKGDLQKATLAVDEDQQKQRIAYSDKKIDALVYELYGLTEEEIKIVEG